MARIVGLLRDRALEAELDEEVRSHLEMAAEEYVARGMSPREADRAARRDFGRVEPMKERHRDVRGLVSVRDFLRDLRVSGRSVLRQPGFALGVALTLGLGIGATTAVYTVVDGVLLRPLPYDDPSTLVAVGSLRPGAEWVNGDASLQNLAPISFPNFLDLRERTGSLEELVAILPFEDRLESNTGDPEPIRLAAVTPGLLVMFGVSPALGRSPAPDEYVASPEVVLLSHETWQGRYGADPSIVGRTLEGLPEPATVIGVLPENFSLPEAFFPRDEAPELWLPYWDEVPHSLNVRRERNLYLLGRLADGRSVEQARTEAARIAADLAVEHPDDNVDQNGSPLGIGVNGLYAQTVGTTGRALGLFLGAAGLLLLLAAMNAATLLFSRALDRTPEIRVRMALGAGRGRVVRLLVAEAGVLAVIGGALGVLLAYGGVAVFLRYAPVSVPRLGAVAVDPRVLAVATLVSLGTGMATGLLPALRLTRGGPWERAKGAGRTFGEPSSRLRSVLVGGQMAVAVVLLTGAALLFGSFVWMRSGGDLGFDAEGLVAMGVEGKTGASSWNFQAHWISWDALQDELGALPGVESVAITSNAPFQAPKWLPKLHLPGEIPETAGPDVAGYAITPGYLETMRIRLLEGRDFQREDGPGAERVALVNETFVRTALPGGDPIGATVLWSAGTEWAPGDDWVPPEEWLVGESTPIRIVGVVEDVVQTHVKEGPRPAIYIPHTQSRPYTPRAVIRTTQPPAAMFPDLRGAAARFNSRDPDPVLELGGLGPPDGATLRFQTILIGGFALIATLLAAAGLYGSLAHTVRRRERELGVRLALGAGRAGVLRMVLGQGMRLSLGGLAVGILAALAFSRLLTGFLYGIEPNDPRTLLMVVATIVVVSAAACVIPARWATAVDIVRVLKSE